MMEIPRIFHQFWLHGQLPPTVEEWRRRLVELHPNWEFRLWTARTLPPLINEAQFLKFSSDRFRVAVARYEILAHFGGVAIDADVEVTRNIEPLVQETDHLFVWQSLGVVSTSLMAMAPNHAIAWALVRELPASCRLFDIEVDTLQVGGHFVTRVLDDRFPKAAIASERTLLHPNYLLGDEWSAGDPATYGVHHMGSLHAD